MGPVNRVTVIFLLLSAVPHSLASLPLNLAPSLFLGLDVYFCSAQCPSLPSQWEGHFKTYQWESLGIWDYGSRHCGAFCVIILNMLPGSAAEGKEGILGFLI